MSQPDVLIIPPVTPEQLYFQDKRRRDWDAKELRITRAVEYAQARGVVTAHYEMADFVKIERRYTLMTDDPEEALRELSRQRATGMMGWDMAEVRQMTVPPKTAYRYCVFRDVRLLF